MEILRSRTIFLIVGILNLTVVNGQTSNQITILENIKQQADETNSVHSVQFKQELVKFKKSVRAICNANGRENAYDDAERGLEKFNNCLVSVFERNSGSGPATSELDDVIKFYCPKVQPFDDCIEQLSNSINPCLDDESSKAVEKWKNFTISYLNYICENEGEHIKTFEIDGGPNCVASHQTQLENCFDVFIKSESGETENSYDEFMKFLLVDPNVDDCKSLKASQYCVKEELEKCTDTSISEIGTSVLDLFFEKMDCEKIIASAASPTTIINSILVITWIVMFL